MPPSIAERCRVLRRSHDVREEHRGQHAVRLVRLAHAGEELLHLRQQPVGIFREEQVVAAHELHVLRAWNVFREIATVLDAREGIARAMQDQGRHADCRQDRPGVGVERAAQKRDGGPGTGRESLVPRPPIAHRLVVGLARHQCFERDTFAPSFFDGVKQRLGVGRADPARIVVAPREPRVGVEQEERCGSLGVCRGEQEMHRPRLRGPEERGPCRAGRVHHRSYVVHALVERGELIERHGIRESGAALVEEDQAAERRKPTEEPGDARLLPEVLDVGDPAMNEYEVDRALARDLVRDVDVSALRVFRFGNHC